MTPVGAQVGRQWNYEGGEDGGGALQRPFQRVALGIIDAGSHSDLMRQGFIDDKYIQAAVANVPLKVWGKSIDGAEAVTYLASSRARFVNGQAINVVGG